MDFGRFGMIFGTLWLDLDGFGSSLEDLDGFGSIGLDLDGLKALGRNLERFGRILEASVGFWRKWNGSACLCRVP